MKLDRKTRTIILIIFGIFFAFSPIFITNFNFKGSKFKVGISFDNENLKNSKISGKIHIINNSGWVDFKSNEYCTGSGTYSDPYIIEDLIFNIDGTEEGNCIWIENTDVYFIIQNCTLSRAVRHLIAGSQIFVVTGIKIENTTNGKLINNSVGNNYNKGIFLEHSQNITISGNTANSERDGIYLDESHNNTISGNIANNNLLDGISLIDCNNSTILGNTAKDNGFDGVSLYDSDNNQISKNTLKGNQYGISLSHSNNNTIIDNILLGNTQSHWFVSGDSIGNVFSGNTIPVNKWPLIIISIIIGCCIIVVVVVVGVIIYRKRTAISREVKKEEKKRLKKETAEILLQLTQESKREGILNCFYHPERDASTKCEKCGKMICPECKTVYHEIHSTGTGDSRSSYSIRREFCPVCFYDQKISLALLHRKARRIGASIFTIIVLIVVFVLIILKGWTDSLIILPFLIPIDILAFVYGPHKEEVFEHQKAEFLNSLKMVQPVKEERLKELFCPECGSQLEPEDSICSYCGSIIKELAINKEFSLQDSTPITVGEEARKLNVFLSYSTLDANYFQIEKIVRRLEFYPEINDVLFWEEDSKQNIVEFMEQTLNKTQVFVLFCSENSIKSEAVKGEWQSAYQMVKAGLMKIIPVYEVQEYIPKLLWKMLNVKFTKDNFDEFIEKLYKEILR